MHPTILHAPVPWGPTCFAAQYPRSHSASLTHSGGTLGYLVKIYTFPCAFLLCMCGMCLAYRCRFVCAFLFLAAKRCVSKAYYLHANKGWTRIRRCQSICNETPLSTRPSKLIELAPRPLCISGKYMNTVVTKRGCTIKTKRCSSSQTTRGGVGWTSGTYESESDSDK